MPTTSPDTSKRLSRSEAILPLGLLGVLVIMLIPLPPFLLDLLLAGNLCLTILLLLITMGARRALDLSVFPSLLLLLTLYRLSLNVATTRVILLSANAGKLVEAFGDFVVGGNLIVGLVIFLILIVIQFVVITKGAGRISEVAARFTLDALPGKQMSIDAELNAGAIDEQEAKHRREQLAQETEFYGAMDGASKFVRGDAIAGMIITAINLIGGMALGMTHGMSLMDSLSRYSILTVGDGLISQIPALIIAITAGILVTKTTSDHTLGQEIEHQVFRQERPLWIGMGVIGLLALMPGIPKFPFLGLGIGLLLLLARRPSKTPSTESSPPDPRPHGTAPPDDGIDDFLIRDRATVEVGTGLITLVNAHRGKPLADRITSLRKDLARDRGLWIPPIRVRSQLHLHADAYRVLIAGRVVGSGTLRAEKMLAIPPDSLAVAIPGEETLEPAFQLPAKWIDPSLTHQAESHRYTVVDAASVLITHLGEVLKSHAHELLTREALKELLDQVRQFAPTIVDELRSESVRMAVLHQVLQQLAEDSVPLSDFAFILEAISNCGQQHKAPDELADAVRVQLGRLVCERSRNSQGALRIVAFEPRLEARFRELVRDGQLALAPRTLEKLLSVLRDAWQRSHRQNLPLALLVEKSLRRPVRKLLKRAVPPLPVIAYQEVPSDMELDPVDVFREEQIFDAKDLLPKANPPVSANPTETTPAQRAA